VKSEFSSLWKVMQASYQILNKTNPNLTKDCWLCYNIRPPYYEGVGVDSNPKRSNETNPQQCLWRKGKETLQGLILSQVTGQGRCVG
ncbi:ENV2 protein, partial [Pitta sordida]|nr:ENV2 protein [Pitta sordida]